MPDELDRMLQGENQDSPSDSQSENASSGSESETDTDNGEQGTDGSQEEVEWNKLSGSATDRFRKVYNDRQRTLAENQRLRDLLTQGGQLPNQNGNQMNPQTQDALTKLDKAGVATKDFVQAKVNEILAQKTYYDELGKLESKLDGNDGKPKFSREEYFDYIDRYPQYKNYLPEDVYEKMYKEELSDWRGSKGQEQTPQRRSQILRPTRTASRDTEMSADDIEAKLKSLPESQRTEWLAANYKKVNEAVARMNES